MNNIEHVQTIKEISFSGSIYKDIWNKEVCVKNKSQRSFKNPNNANLKLNCLLLVISNGNSEFEANRSTGMQMPQRKLTDC